MSAVPAWKGPSDSRPSDSRPSDIWAPSGRSERRRAQRRAMVEVFGQRDPESWVWNVVGQVRSAVRHAQMRERAAFDSTLQARQDFEAAERVLLAEIEAAEDAAARAEQRCKAVSDTYNLYEFYLRQHRIRPDAVLRQTAPVPALLIE